MKKKIIIFLGGLIILTGIILAIIIPLSFRTIKITSFDNKTTLTLSAYKMGEIISADEDNRSAIIKVSDSKKFYNDMLKKYTIDGTSNIDKGYMVYNGSCFLYEKGKGNNEYFFKEAITNVNGKILLSFGYGMTPPANTNSEEKDYTTYTLFDLSYADTIKIIDNLDSKYYLKREDKYYLKAYKIDFKILPDGKVENNYVLTNYIELIEYNGKAAWKTHNQDGSLTIDSSNIDLFK